MIQEPELPEPPAGLDVTTLPPGPYIDHVVQNGDCSDLQAILDDLAGKHEVDTNHRILISPDKDCNGVNTTGGNGSYIFPARPNHTSADPTKGWVIVQSTKVGTNEFAPMGCVPVLHGQANMRSSRTTSGTGRQPVAWLACLIRCYTADGDLADTLYRIVSPPTSVFPYLYCGGDDTNPASGTGGTAFPKYDITTSCDQVTNMTLGTTSVIATVSCTDGRPNDVKVGMVVNFQNSGYLANGSYFSVRCERQHHYAMACHPLHGNLQRLRRWGFDQPRRVLPFFGTGVRRN